MIYTKDEQAEYRKKFIDEAKDKAWSTMAQVAFIRDVQMKPVNKDLESAQKRIEKIDAEVKTIEEGKDYHTVENRKKANGLKTEKNEILARVNGNGSKEDRGLIGRFMDMANLAQKYEADVERFLQLAEFSKSWDFKEVETAKVDEAEKKSEVKK